MLVRTKRGLRIRCGQECWKWRLLLYRLWLWGKRIFRGGGFGETARDTAQVEVEQHALEGLAFAESMGIYLYIYEFNGRGRLTALVSRKVRPRLGRACACEGGGGTLTRTGTSSGARVAFVLRVAGVCRRGSAMRSRTMGKGKALTRASTSSKARDACVLFVTGTT